ncbi:MAG: GNAT family N-acetyltransferase [Cyanobacteriota bacterium]|nr:GNAT family N-acetyltransferase [Cyanobacteriota bacterium]
MNLSIRQLRADELAEADRICRIAFGTFVASPNPEQFFGDASYIFHLWQANPQAAFAAEIQGQLVGSNLAIGWGSFGFFGPLSVHPDFWNQGIGKPLVAATVDYLKQKEVRHLGLFTFANSPKHHALYQKFGFYPRFLTMVMAKSTHSARGFSPQQQYSTMTQQQQIQALEASRELTDEIYEGLDVSSEIQSVWEQKLGDTVFLWEEDGLAGFAVCHCGAGTEAGSNTCYAKFGAVRGSAAAQRFNRLLDLCEALSVARGMTKLVAGTNTSREKAYRQMCDRGFRAEMVGVAMHNPNEPAYNRPDVFVIDDWR